MKGYRTLVGQFPKQEQRIHTRNHRATLGMILVSLVIISPLFLVCTAVIIFQVQGWNLPGVVIYEQNVGWKSLEETIEVIDEIWNQDRTISLVSSSNAENRYEFSTRELGYWIDPAATGKAAFNIGRTSTPLLDLQAAIKGESHLIMPELYFDEHAARETLKTLIEDLTIPAQDARLIFRDGSWSVIPGVEGQMLDIEETLLNLSENSITNLISQSAILQMTPISPQLYDLMPVMSDIETVTTQELSLSAYDPITDETYHWSVIDELKNTWVIVDPETYQVQLSLNSRKH